ncbi:hypothetical protein VIGAN_11102000 [Vigna angularis var. angularis]|uniref:Uncharacterized protein n=1 Tax=Vigna angularis var. angularis TaxID=157739 RepID=A0A0S3T940_PHAAN|nr:hypothetical protein VIGAN_11102000 [Vigna angularis var. angularis]
MLDFIEAGFSFILFPFRFCASLETNSGRWRNLTKPPLGRNPNLELTVEGTTLRDCSMVTLTAGLKKLALTV